MIAAQVVGVLCASGLVARSLRVAWRVHSLQWLAVGGWRGSALCVDERVHVTRLVERVRAHACVRVHASGT